MSKYSYKMVVSCCIHKIIYIKSTCCVLISCVPIYSMVFLLIFFPSIISSLFPHVSTIQTNILSINRLTIYTCLNSLKLIKFLISRSFWTTHGKGRTRQIVDVWPTQNNIERKQKLVWKKMKWNGFSCGKIMKITEHHTHTCMWATICNMQATYGARNAQKTSISWESCTLFVWFWYCCYYCWRC